MSQKIVILKQDISVPGAGVESVAGRSGVVTLTKSDVGLGNVDNTSNATERAATTTLTNKTIVGANNTISGITEAMLSTADNTTLNVSTSKHGFAPKAPNDATKYLDGTGAYTVPAGGGGGTWGSITGTLADQTDLQTALNTKPTLVGGLVPVANLATGTPTGSKFIRDDGTLQTIGGGGDALVANPLSQFAATTSAQLRGVLSDETGTGAAVFAGGNVGAATATTASPADNSTKVATTAFVQANQPVLMANANGVLTTNTAAQNTTALQALIDAGTALGVTIYFTEPVPMNGNLLLKSNVKLAGNNFSALKGSVKLGGGSGSAGSTPSGAAFLITDTTNVFITVQTNTSIDGIIFHYPSQAYTTTTPGASLVVYPATIKKTTGTVNNLSFTRLTFVGNTQCYDFYTTADATNWIADVVIDLNYAYPLGGVFVKMQYCLDIPRITRCHINPGVGDAYLGHLPVTNEIIDYVAANGAPTFELANCDEFMLSESFCFGVRTAFFLNDSYGTLVNCNADQVETGCHVTITADYRYVALLSFSVILGGGTLASRNGVLFDGSGGKLYCTNLNGITSTSGVVPSSNTPGGNSLLKVSGSSSQRVSLYGARTRSVDGAWAKFIDQTNGSAIVSYLDSDQQDVTSGQNAGQVTNLQMTTPTIGVAAATTINKVAITAPATSATLTIVNGKTLTASNTLALAGTDGTTMTFPPASASIGYINVPQNSQSTAYTTVLADQGKHILHPAADTTARTVTIDSNANVAFPIGTAITFVNENSAGVLTIAITSDTMRLAGAGTTGSRSLAANGVATALKVTSTSWIISGTGLT